MMMTQVLSARQLRAKCPPDYICDMQARVSEIEGQMLDTLQ